MQVLPVKVNLLPWLIQLSHWLSIFELQHSWTFVVFPFSLLRRSTLTTEVIIRITAWAFLKLSLRGFFGIFVYCLSDYKPVVPGAITSLRYLLQRRLLGRFRLCFSARRYSSPGFRYNPMKHTFSGFWFTSPIHLSVGYCHGVFNFSQA